MNIVFVKGLRIYAYHGVLPQEKIVGSYFMISVKIKTDFSNAIQTDNLDGTISYAEVCNIIKREMSITSNLLEHVAGRIVNALLSHFINISSIWLSISKENPPMGVQCKEVGIEIEVNR